MNPSQLFSSARLIGACLALIATSQALALPSDRDQEIHILAKTASANQKEGIVIYSGDVKLTQGTLEITAEKVTIRTNDKQKVETILAEGSPAKFQQQPDAAKAMVHAQAYTINYIVSKDHVTLDKNAFIEQNGATTKGGRVEYDITNGTVKASGEGDKSQVEFVIPPQTDKKE